VIATAQQVAQIIVERRGKIGNDFDADVCDGLDAFALGAQGGGPLQTKLVSEIASCKADFHTLQSDVNGLRQALAQVSPTTSVAARYDATTSSLAAVSSAATALGGCIHAAGTSADKILACENQMQAFYKDSQALKTKLAHW
jgi:hypothetical protein